MFSAFKPDWTLGGPLEKCDRKLSTKWQRNLHFIMEKSAEPRLYLDKIESLNNTHPDWPFALVRLGKAYLLLEDIHGALEQFEKAQSLLSPLEDETFAQYVEGLRAYVKQLETEEDCEWAEPSDGIITSHWAPPKDISQYQFSDTPRPLAIKSAWKDLLSEDRAGTISAHYARLLCIETNELEGVFTLGGKSLPRLVKVGFYTGAIDRVQAEGVQEWPKIVSILEDLQNCLDLMMDIVKNPSQLSEDTITQIHRIILKSCRISSHFDGEDMIFYLTLPGIYRKRLTTTSLTPGNIVQYTHQSKVPGEMALFVDMLRKCLGDQGIPPFAAAAWIHTTFARIHPFTNGNGRVARLLASLPLIHAGYPFINIRGHKKDDYLQALFKAQTTTDLQPLMEELMSSMVDSIDYIKSLPPNTPEDEQYRFSIEQGITKLSL